MTPVYDETAETPMARCTDEHARFCSQCTTAKAYNSIHCQDCPEGRPSAATAARTVTIDADDLDALINLTERSIQMLRSRWNDLPENERQAFVRLREVADHWSPSRQLTTPEVRGDCAD